jgi:two-component system, LytTR family, sensor kinase
MVKNKTIKTNFIFWTCYFLYEWLANAAYDSQYKMHLVTAALYTPILFAATYFTIHVLVKKYFFTSQKSKFWAGLIVSVLVFGISRRAVNYFIIYQTYSPDWMTTQPFLFPVKIIFEIVGIYLFVGLYAMFYFTQAWYEQQRITQNLQKDKVEAQLELLKSQVQPHFIFNTLNNIYSLSTQNSPKTSDLIYRLSSLLSYTLYDSRRPIVPLEQEIEYISNYIELEKIRYGDRLDIAVNILNDTKHIGISPFLLLPLVENCFKHGASNEIDTCWIRLDILHKDGWLIIKAENSKSSNGHHNGTRNGIGLENVKKRLEILYPGSHELKCMSEEQSYLVVLKIKTIVHEDKMPAGR